MPFVKKPYCSGALEGGWVGLLQNGRNLCIGVLMWRVHVLLHYWGKRIRSTICAICTSAPNGRVHWGSEGAGREGSQVTLEGLTEI